MIRPIHDHVIVRKDESEELSKGGIFIPEVARDKKPVERGIVVAVGPGKRTKKGARCAPDVSVGERVFYRRHSERQTYEHEGTEHLVLREGDLLGAVTS